MLASSCSSCRQAAHAACSAGCASIADLCLMLHHATLCSCQRWPACPVLSGKRWQGPQSHPMQAFVRPAPWPTLCQHQALQISRNIASKGQRRQAANLQACHLPSSCRTSRSALGCPRAARRAAGAGRRVVSLRSAPPAFPSHGQGQKGTQVWGERQLLCSFMLYRRYKRGSYWRGTRTR